VVPELGHATFPLPVRAFPVAGVMIPKREMNSELSRKCRHSPTTGVDSPAEFDY
jgi:hypothetical protein